MVVCGLNECKASARPLSFVVRADLAAAPIRLAGIVRTALRKNVCALALPRPASSHTLLQPRLLHENGSMHIAPLHANTYL